MIPVKKILLVLLISFVVLAAIGIFASLLIGCGGNKLQLVEGRPTLIFRDGAVAPNVALSKYFMTRNSKPTGIKSFSKGKNLQVINILFGDDNTTVIDTGTIDLMGGLDFTPRRGDSIIFTRVDGVWHETYRQLSEEN